jgi:hypothetical protein
MKKLLLILLFSVLVYSDILYLENNRCIKDDYYFQSGRFYFTYSDTNENAFSDSFQATDLEYGFEYIDYKCQKLQVLQNTKMTYANYKFMMALTGLLLGFVIFMSVIYIFIKRNK